MGNDGVNASVVDALTIANTKTVAEAAAFALAQTYQDVTDDARRVHLMGEAHIGKYLHQQVTIDPVEAVANTILFRGMSDSGISSILGQLATGQIATKVAISTPPESGVTGQIAQMMALVAVAKSAFNATKPTTTPKV